LYFDFQEESRQPFQSLGSCAAHAPPLAEILGNPELPRIDSRFPALSQSPPAAAIAYTFPVFSTPSYMVPIIFLRLSPNKPERKLPPA
jgi:hypothetical protein